MPSIARPIADVTVDTWSRPDGATSKLFEEINDEAPFDRPIRTGEGPEDAVYVCKLSRPYPSAPDLRTDHAINLRCKKDAAGGPAVNLTVELREGYASEGAPGTLIFTDTVADLDGEAWADVRLEIPEASAETITDYGNLFLRVVADQEAEA